MSGLTFINIAECTADCMQGGCIIRAIFLTDIYEAYKRNPALENLLVDPEFAKKLVSSEQAWRSVVTKVLPCPAASVPIYLLLFTVVEASPALFNGVAYIFIHFSVVFV